MSFLSSLQSLIARLRKRPVHVPPLKAEDAEVTEAKEEEQEDKAKEQNDLFNKWVVPNLGKLIYLGGCGLIIVTAKFEPFWLNMTWSILLGLMLWSGVYLAFGLIVIPQQEALVIERFGKFQRTTTAGIRILCFRGLVDKERSSVNLQWRTLFLWTGGTGKLNSSAEIDFSDGVSAPVEVEVIYRVTSPFAWTYQVADGPGYIEAVIDSALRPALQNLTLDVANKKKGDIGHEILNGERSTILKDAMALVGAELHPLKGILVKDIDIPEDVKALRTLKVQGEQNALKATAQAAGYTGAIKAIMADAQAAGHQMTWHEAEALYFRNRSLETLQGTGANVTIIGENIMGVAQSLLGKVTPNNSGSTSTEPHSPQGGSPLSPRRRK